MRQLRRLLLRTTFTPGYALLLSSKEMMDNADLFDEDVARLRNLPHEPLAELKRYLELLLAGEWPEDPACIWLDRKTMKCRYYEYRPMICREFAIGSEDCLGWRQQYVTSQENK